MQNLSPRTCAQCGKVQDDAFAFCPWCGGGSAAETTFNPSASRPAYSWIWEEPGAVFRYYRIGLGLTLWATLLLFTALPMAALLSSLVMPTFLDSEHDHSINWLLVLGGGAVILILQILVLALCLGGLLRLLRDVVRDALFLPAAVTAARRSGRVGAIALLCAGVASLSVVTTLIVPRTNPATTNVAPEDASKPSSPTASAETISRVAAGVSEKDILQLLGEPMEREGNKWTWSGDFGEFEVEFNNQKVVHFGIKKEP